MAGETKTKAQPPANAQARRSKASSSGGVRANALSVAIFIIIVVIARNALSMKRENRRRRGGTHPVWLPLSRSEMAKWEFTPLTSPSEDVGVFQGGEQVPKMSPGLKAEAPKVHTGWKITCGKMPCKELLPGNLANGGIISVHGIYGSCFDVLFGDDELTTGARFAGQAILFSVRDPSYAMVNVHSGAWESESEQRGQDLFAGGQKFKVDFKFLNAKGETELIVSTGGAQIARRKLEKAFVAALHKMHVVPSEYQNCRAKSGAGDTVVSDIMYLEK